MPAGPGPDCKGEDPGPRAEVGPVNYRFDYNAHWQRETHHITQKSKFWVRE